MEQILKRTYGDKKIWAIVLLLCFFSFIIIYSSIGSLAFREYGGNTEKVLIRHVGFMAFGLLVMWVVHQVNYTIFKRLATLMFYCSIPLLIYALLFGAKINDGARWIKIPFIGLTFQASDFAKLALFTYLANQLSEIQNEIQNFKIVARKIIAPVILVVALIAAANLSTAIMILVSCSLLFFIGRVQIKHLAYLALIGIAGLSIIYGISKITGIGRAGTWEKRLESFTKSTDFKDQPVQELCAKVAIAQGSVFYGKGPGKSTQRNFLPHCYSDMVYPIIIEEYGLIGGAGIILLYILLLWRSIVIFRKCPYAFGAFLSIGLSFTLVFQAMLNMAVGVSLVPVTGLTLPLISMGGSSVFFTGTTLGIILSVSKYVDDMEGKNKKNAIPQIKPEVQKA